MVQLNYLKESIVQVDHARLCNCVKGQCGWCQWTVQLARLWGGTIAGQCMVQVDHARPHNCVNGQCRQCQWTMQLGRMCEKTIEDSPWCTWTMQGHTIVRRDNACGASEPCN